MNSDPATAFDRIAPFYDLDLEDDADDAAFYARLAAYHGPRVLELGCGTGRVALRLAREGLEVTGVDVSEAMLAAARSALEAAEHGRPGGISARFLAADLRTLDLDEQFDLVCAPLGTFQHLESVDDVVAGMECVERHLVPGAIAVVDVEAPHAEDWNPAPQPLVEHWTKPRQDGQVTKLVSIEPHPAEGVRDVTWHFDIVDAAGVLRRVTARFTLRVITAAELDLAGRVAGLRLAATFGDYDFAPYDAGSERLIALFQRADDAFEYAYLADGDEVPDRQPATEAAS